MGTLYVLDEPSIGLHARDTMRLADLCHELAQAGNTVVVVEHDREFIGTADHIVELGPGSERGRPDRLQRSAGRVRRDALAHRALRLGARIDPGAAVSADGPARADARRRARAQPQERDAPDSPPYAHAVSGVSGSGKSTLVHDTLYRAAARAFKTDFAPPGAYDALVGIEYIKGVRLIDQEPIGRTRVRTRSPT